LVATTNPGTGDLGRHTDGAGGDTIRMTSRGSRRTGSHVRGRLSAGRCTRWCCSWSCGWLSCCLPPLSSVT